MPPDENPQPQDIRGLDGDINHSEEELSEKKEREDVQLQARSAVSFYEQIAMPDQIDLAIKKNMLVTSQEKNLALQIQNRYTLLKELGSNGDFNPSLVKLTLERFTSLQRKFHELIRSKEGASDRKERKNVAKKVLDTYEQYKSDRSKLGLEAFFLAHRLHRLSEEEVSTRLQIDVLATQLASLCDKLNNASYAMQNDKKELDQAAKNLDEYIGPEELGPLREGKKGLIVKKLESHGLRTTWLHENDPFGFGSFYKIERKDGVVAYLESAPLSGPELTSSYRLYQNINRKGAYMPFHMTGDSESFADRINLFMEKYAHTFQYHDVVNTNDFEYEAPGKKMFEELRSIDELLATVTRNLASPEGYEEGTWKIERMESLSQTRTVLIQLRNALNAFIEDYNITDARTNGKRLGPLLFQHVMVNGVQISLEKIHCLEQLQRKVRNTLEYLDGPEAVADLKKEFDSKATEDFDSVKIGTIHWMKIQNSPTVYDLLRKTSEKRSTPLGYVKLKEDPKSPIELHLKTGEVTSFSTIKELQSYLK